MAKQKKNLSAKRRAKKAQSAKRKKYFKPSGKHRGYTLEDALASLLR